MSIKLDTLRSLRETVSATTSSLPAIPLLIYNVIGINACISCMSMSICFLLSKDWGGGVLLAQYLWVTRRTHACHPLSLSASWVPVNLALQQVDLCPDRDSDIKASLSLHLSAPQHIMLPSVLPRQSHPRICFLPSAKSAPYSLCLTEVLRTESYGQCTPLDRAHIAPSHLQGLILQVQAPSPF